MTKNELADALTEQVSIGKSTALLTIEALMKIMTETFAAGENIYLRGFGTYKVVQRKAKTARNITKESQMIVPPHRAVKFIPCDTLKEKVK